MVSQLNAPQAPREATRLEILQDRVQNVVQGLDAAANRLSRVADNVLGFPPPTPATKDGSGAVPIADAKVQRLSQQLDDAVNLLSRVFNQIDRLETL